MNNNFEVNEKGQRIYEGITFGEENKPVEFNSISFNDRYDLQRSVYNPQTIIEISKIGRVELFEGLEIDVYGDINNTWFLGSDVARLIDYTEVRPGTYDVRAMLKNMDQTMVCTFRDSCSTLSTTTPNLGGNPDKLFINEIGLYTKLASSRKLEARKYMIMIFERLRAIRMVTGELAFTHNTYQQFDEINSLFRDSRVGKNKVLELIEQRTGSKFEDGDDDFNYFKFLSDAGLVTLDEEGLIIDYDNKCIRCIENNLLGKHFFTPDYFKYDGVVLVNQYLNSLNF